MLLVVLIFHNEPVLGNGSILYCLIKTKYFSSSHSLPPPSTELFSLIKTVLNIGLFQSYCKLWLWSALSANETYNSVTRHRLRLQLDWEYLLWWNVSELLKLLSVGEALSIRVWLCSRQPFLRRESFLYVHRKYCWLLGVSFICIYEILKTNQTINGHLVQLFIKKIMLKTDQNRYHHWNQQFSICSYLNPQPKNVFRDWELNTCVNRGRF